MRTQDIVIGETYRHKDHPNYGYAKALKIIRPMPEFKKRTALGLTEEEKMSNTFALNANGRYQKMIHLV